MKKIFLPIFVFFLTACQTNLIKTNDDSVSYNFLFTPASHVNQLLQKGDVDEAMEVYSTEIDFFITKKESEQETIKNIFVAYDKRNNEKISNTLQQLQKFEFNSNDTLNWPTANKLINDGFNIYQSYSKYEFWDEFSNQKIQINQIKNLSEDLKNKYLVESVNEFILFDYINNDFFNDYPVGISNKLNIYLTNKEKILSNLKSKSKEDISKFAKSINIQSENGDEFDKFLIQIGDIYYDKCLTKQSGFRLMDQLQAYEKVIEAGLKTSNNLSQKIAIVDGSSQSLLQAGQLEFPVSLDTGYFENVKAVSLLKALDNNSNYDYAIVFSTNAAKTERRIQKRDKVSSQFVSGKRDVPNPAYEQAKLSVYQIQSELNNINNQYCQGWACLAKGISQGIVGGKLRDAQETFSNTPMMLSEDVLSQYQYSKSRMTSRKMVTTNYYLLDLRTKKMLSGVFDVSETKDFTVAYNLNDKDTKYSSILRSTDSESDVSSFEKKDVIVSLKSLIEHASSKKSKFVSYNPSYENLKSKVLADRHLAIKKYKVKSDSVLPADDKRMDHVVVIYNPAGSLGTGFYVGPDLVLTNYHVVEGSDYMEIKTHAGLETFGKVEKSDVRLDLALIKVQQRGNPVTFYSGSIPLGSTVEAIGHPKGLEFSITRGIVSAIRERDNVYGIGGKKVTFVQTDTAINPGNSGGPMFLGDKVIAVNNNKRVEEGVEGLGFSIHYTEVENFLRKDF